MTHTPDAAQIVAALAACEESHVPIVLAHPALQYEDVRALCRTVGARVFLNNSLEWVSVPDAVEGRRCAFTVSLMTSNWSSERLTRCRTVVIPSLSRQLVARTDSWSASST